MSANLLLELHNEYQHFSLFADASAELIDVKTGTHWCMGPVAVQEDRELDPGHNWLRTSRSVCEQYPGRFKGSIEGSAVRFTVLGHLNAEMGTFTCRYRLDGPWLEVEILDVDAALPNLMFPTAIVSEQLVLPSGIGKLIRKSDGLYDRHAYRFPTHLNMRFFGGLRGDAGWIGIFADGYADAGVLTTQMAATPLWMKSLNRWQGRRTIRYGFTSGGYVGIAKTFRAWAKEHGLFKTLVEKIAANPAVGNLIGGRAVGFMMARPFRKQRYEDRCEPVPAKFQGHSDGVVTLINYSQTRRIMDECKSLGMNKGLFTLHGWINGGYDETHPDIWPPEPALGSIDELRGLCAERDPYLSILHDNYQDIYPQSPSFPNGICQRRDGSFLPGGIWAGGQCYILNSTASLEYARRNWPNLASLNPRGIYADTITAELFKESYERDHTQTRGQDEAMKRELMQFFHQRGVVFSSENGADFGVPFTDWIPPAYKYVAGQSIPLWPMVYHDCVIGIQGTWSPEDHNATRMARSCLENMLWGNMLFFAGFTAEDWPQFRKSFADTFHVDRWHGQIGTAEMTNHRYLTDDFAVEKTEFATGDAVICNFASEPRQVEGKTIPAGGYVLVN